MIMEKERKQLINYGKKLVIEKLTKGTGGNLSIFDRNLGYIAITPSGIDFFEMNENDKNIAVFIKQGFNFRFEWQCSSRRKSSFK